MDPRTELWGQFMVQDLLRLAWHWSKVKYFDIKAIKLWDMFLILIELTSPKRLWNIHEDEQDTADVILQSIEGGHTSR